MKPLKRSNHDASKAPNSKRKRSDESQTQQDTQLKKGKHRKAESHSQRRIIKGQENWKPMSASCLADLEKMIDFSILSTLGKKQNNKKEFQEHLNALKKKFLKHCSTIKIPSDKQKLQGAAHHLLNETKKLEAEKQTLGSLEENLMAVVTTLEKNEHMINALEPQCSALRNKLQDQEEEFEEIFQRKEAVVHLLLPRPTPDQTTLQEKMKSAFPEIEAEAMARKLGELLQNSKSLEDAPELLVLWQRQIEMI